MITEENLKALFNRFDGISNSVFKANSAIFENGNPVINIEIHCHFEGEIDKLTINEKE